MVNDLGVGCDFCLLFYNINMCHRIRYCVFSCPRTISIVSSNQILCHCSGILLITGSYIYLPVFYSAIHIYRYYTIYRYSALLLFHSLVSLSQCCWVLVLSSTILYWYLFTIHLLLKTSIVFTYSL